MPAYLLRRLLLLVPVLLGVSVVTFSLMHVTPGDPVDVMLGESASPADREALRRQLRLDRPLPEQFALYLAGLLRGDLQQSFHFRRGVAGLIGERYPRTLLLAGVAMTLAVGLSLPVGILAAVRQGGAVDTAATGLSLLGIALPSFWLGPMLVLLFSVRLGWLPVAGAYSVRHLVLPAVTLGTALMALLTRMTRTALLETLREDYVRTAHAKGLSPRSVLLRHALRNALVPVITVVGLQFGAILAGAVITEKVFDWPGLGLLLVEGIWNRDLPVVQGCVLVIATSYVLVNLATDLLYAWADPRISVG